MKERSSKYFPTRRLQNSWSALSSVNLGDLPVNVHAGGKPRVIDGKLDSQANGLNHNLNPLESSSHSA